MIHIDPEVSILQYIFEAFHRGENVSDIPGTGLGMAIVKRCVDLQNGTIDIESTLGCGTKIILNMPYLK